MLGEGKVDSWKICVFHPLFLSKQKRTASAQKSMDFPILQSTGAREEGSGETGEEKESTKTWK